MEAKQNQMIGRWAATDIHISVHGLIVALLPAMLPPRVIAAVFASRGGQSTSAAKRHSAQENGRKSGSGAGDINDQSRHEASAAHDRRLSILLLTAVRTTQVGTTAVRSSVVK